MDAAAGEPGTLAWAGVIPDVASHSRVIAYDRAGLGLSDPAEPLTLETSIGDLAALAAHAGGGCILAGHSWGGLLAQLVTHQTCYSKRSQVAAFPAELRLLDTSTLQIRRIRTKTALPDMPIVVLSATEGAREDHREA